MVITQCNKEYKSAHDRIGRCLYLHVEADLERNTEPRALAASNGSHVALSQHYAELLVLLLIKDLPWFVRMLYSYPVMADYHQSRPSWLHGW